MNKNQMHQIFAHYIDNFEKLNDPEHSEYYKWQVCHKFRPLMDEALAADVDDFADALYRVKDCSKNIIDSYTQPFYGLVEFARREPETVQRMFWTSIFPTAICISRIYILCRPIFFVRSGPSLHV